MWYFRNVLFIAAVLFCLCALTIEGHYRCPSNLPQTTAIRAWREKCYQFVYVEKHWTKARDFCWQHGGRLVKIDDKATQEFITTALNSLTWTNDGVWTGLHDRSDELRWQWVGKTGEADERLHHWNWDSGHPGAFLHSQKDCVRMTRDSGWKWHETYCSVLKWHYRFICEYDMAPETTTKASTNVAGGVLPFGQNSQKPSTENKKIDSTSIIDTTSHTAQKTTTTPADKTTIAKLSKWDYEDNLVEPVARAQHKDESKDNAGIIGSVVGCGVGAVLILILILFLLYRRKKGQEKVKEPTVNFSNPTYGSDDRCGGMNNAEARVMCAPNSLPGIARLENLEKATPNLYSDPAQIRSEVRGASAPDGSAGYPERYSKEWQASGDVDVVDIDNLKNLKHVDDPHNKTSNLDVNPNVYVHMDPSAGVAPLHAMYNYVPMDGPRGNSPDLLSSAGSSNSVNSEGVGFPYDKPSTVTGAALVYDVPRPEHIYSEIPEHEPPENIYETLDECRRSRVVASSESNVDV